MPNELIKEKITLNRNMGKETTQVLLEGDIIVPDIKPDMAYILKTDADMIFDKTEVSTGRVNFSGKLCLKVLYLAKGSEKPVHSISSFATVDDFINMEGVDKDNWIELRGNIANIDYKMLNDRKISYKAIIDVSVSAEVKAEFDVVSDISEINENQLRKSVLSIKKTVENKEDRFIVKDELVIPQGKSNIRELLQSAISITNKEIKVSTGRVNINGELIISTLYKGDDDENIIEFVEHELPFNGAVDISGAREGMFADVILVPTEQYIQARSDSDGEDRIIDAEVFISAALKLSEQSEVSVLEDAYIVNKTLDFKKERVKYPRFICRNKNQCPVKEVIELTPDCPDILQIFRVVGNVCIDDLKIIDDKVLVEGIVETDVLYIAKNDDAPLYNYKTFLPFKQSIETKGCKLGMDVTIEKSIDHVGFNMLSNREMEIRFLISFNTSVIDCNEAEIITDIEISDIDREFIDGMASITIYVVQPGDALWHIAKRYNMAIEEIVSINEIEDPNKIYPGQKLLILKKAEI